jgi:hypothetical protein
MPERLAAVEIEVVDARVNPAPDGPHPKADTSANGLLQEIVVAERELVLLLFAQLKARETGELRIATRKNTKTGVTEIVYAGVHDKMDIEGLRQMYTRVPHTRARTF